MKCNRIERAISYPKSFPFHVDDDDETYSIEKWNTNEERTLSSAIWCVICIFFFSSLVENNNHQFLIECNYTHSTCRTHTPIHTHRSVQSPAPTHRTYFIHCIFAYQRGWLRVWVLMYERKCLSKSRFILLHVRKSGKMFQPKFWFDIVTGNDMHRKS